MHDDCEWCGTDFCACGHLRMMHAATFCPDGWVPDKGICEDCNCAGFAEPTPESEAVASIFDVLAALQGASV